MHFCFNKIYFKAIFVKIFYFFFLNETEIIEEDSILKALREEDLIGLMNSDDEAAASIIFIKKEKSF